MYTTYAAMISVSSNRSGLPVSGRPGFWVTALLAFIALCAVPVGAQTPQSATRTCGYAGGPSCPDEAPLVGPWKWFGQMSYSINLPNGIQGMGAIDAWWESWLDQNVPNGGVCAPPSVNWVEQSGNNPLYGPDDVEESNGWFVYYQSPAYKNTLPNIPACSYSFNTSGNIGEIRTVSCPPYTDITGQPPNQQCVLKSSLPDYLKMVGPCPCRKKTLSGDPVDVSDGNNYVVQTDFKGSGVAPLTFTRSYNSVSAHYEAVQTSMPYGMTILGVGWSADYFQYLQPVSGTVNGVTYSTVYAYRPDGRVLAFNLFEGVYSPDGDVDASLQQESNGDWEYQTPNNTLETYNSNGQLLSIARPGEAPITVNYAAGSQPGDPPTSVSDAFGHTLSFTYLTDATGTQRLAAIAEPSGETVQYSYDGTGNLASVTYQDGTQRLYTYVSGGHDLLSITDKSGAVYRSWTYTGYGTEVGTAQLAGGVGAYSYSYSLAGTSGSVTVVDPLGQSCTYGQQLIWGSYFETSASALCPGGGTAASRTLDANGNITSETDFNGNTTVYSYDPTTNFETSRTEAYGTSDAWTVTTKWDPDWRAPDLITEPGRTIAYTYNSMGEVLTKAITDTANGVTRTWSYTYDSDGRRLTATDPGGDTTTYAYYACTSGYQCGELQSVSNALGEITTYDSYDADGRPLTISDPNGTVTTLAYDARGRVISRSIGNETTAFAYQPTGLLAQVTFPDGSSLAFTYDPARRLTEISDGIGDTIKYTLDAMGNRIATRTYDPSGALHRTHARVINALDQVYQDVNSAGTSAVTTTYGYDGNGNLTAVDAPLSRNTSETYDALDRVSSVTDPAGGVTTFGYNAENELTSVSDPRGLTTTYGYDGFGDLTAQDSPDTGSRSFTYDANGSLVTATDARGVVATYSYDALNRVTSVAYSGGDVAPETVSFTYDQGADGIGHLTGSSDGNFSMNWAYDGLGEVVNMSQSVAGVTRSVSYGYTDGDLTSLTTPSGQSVTYGYNAAHEIISIAVNGTTILSGVTYEPFGPVNGWTWGNGKSFSRAFNGDEKITGVSAPGNTESLSYDDADRVSAISNTATDASSWSYGYNALDQLTSATSGTVTDGWTYDANGNRLSQTGTSASTYSVASGSNQLNSISGAVSESYSYDAAGNTVSDSNDTMTYDGAGRLKTLTTSVGTTTFVYNSLGQMIEASGPAGTTIYVYDQDGHLLGEYDGSGSLIRETVWLGNIPVATLRPNGSSVTADYVETDQLGTPRTVIQPSNNALLWTWYSGPFGSAAPNENPSGLGTFTYDLRFAGQIAGAWGGTFQNYNRDYDPATGRYVESDPIGLNGGSFSTYAYADGDPIDRIDPLGLAWQFVFGFGGTAIAPFAGIGASFNIGLNLDGWNSSMYIQDQGNIGLGTGAYVGAGVNLSLTHGTAAQTGFGYQKYAEADAAVGPGIGASVTVDNCGNTSVAPARGLDLHGIKPSFGLGAGAFAGYTGTATAVSPTVESIIQWAESEF